MKIEKEILKLRDKLFIESFNKVLNNEKELKYLINEYKRGNKYKEDLINRIMDILLDSFGS